MTLPVIRQLGRVDYQETWQAMLHYTQQRTVADAGGNMAAGNGADDTGADQIWLLEHPPVYTLGQAGRAEHILDAGSVPVVASDRGGQVTYHGPGQLVVYCLIDLRRRGYGVRHLVERLEQSVIDLCAGYAIDAARRDRAPGVYVDGSKLAALGLRVRHGCTLHGLAINVDMDLAPFTRIDPCGYKGLTVTQLASLGVRAGVDEVAERILPGLLDNLGYN